MVRHFEGSLPSWEGKITRAFDSLLEVQNEAEDFSLTAESLNFASVYEHLIKIEDKYMLLLPEGHNMLDLSPERDKRRLCGCLKPMGIELMHTPD